METMFGCSCCRLTRGLFDVSVVIAVWNASYMYGVHLLVRAGSYCTTLLLVVLKIGSGSCVPVAVEMVSSSSSRNTDWRGDHLLFSPLFANTWDYYNGFFSRGIHCTKFSSDDSCTQTDAHKGMFGFCANRQFCGHLNDWFTQIASVANSYIVH